MKAVKRFLACLLVLGLLSGTLAPGARAAESNVPQSRSENAATAPQELPYSDWEWEVLRLVNTYRHQEGLSPLTGLPILQQATDIRAEELITHFSHTRPDGSDCFTVFGDLGIEIWGSGENIAAGYQSPAEAMDGWMNSPGHRMNILTPGYAHIGVGYAAGDSMYKHHWVQLFSSGGEYTSMTIAAPNGVSFTPGTLIEDMGLYAVLNSGVYGECYLPILSAYCPDFEQNISGTKTITLSFFGLTASIDITIEGEGDWCLPVDGGRLYFDPDTQMIIGAEGIYDLVVPASISGVPVLGIGDGAFRSCLWLHSVTLPDGIQSIGSYAFADSYLMESLNIPASVTHIGEGAFVNTDRLDIQMAEGNPVIQVIDGMLVDTGTATVIHYLTDMPEELTFPESITQIGAGAFYGCRSMDTVTFHAGITYIGANAFTNCLFTDVWFTGNPVSLGENAFTDRPSLTIHYPIDPGNWDPAAYPELSESWWTRYCLTHEWDEGEVTRQPTHDEEGSMLYTCTDCGNWRSEAIPVQLEHIYTAATQLPSCAIEGWTTYECTICDDYYKDDFVPALGHSFGEWIRQGEPTCEDSCGSYRTCTVCGKEERQNVPALGHDYQVAVTPPTCTERGFTTSTCSRCDYEENTDYVEPLGHSFGEWFVFKAPTCDDTGAEQRVCTACGEAEENEIESLGHDYQDTVVPATCTEGGYTRHTCTVCGYNYDDNGFPPTSHSFGEWITVMPVTCVDDGIERQVCTVCGEEEEREIPQLEHDYQPTVVPPTCTMKGYTNHICTGCGQIYSDTDVPALGHTPGDAIVANRRPDGSHDLVTYCTVCGDKVSTVHVEGNAALPGDINGDSALNADDAIYLLYHTLFGGELYPVTGSCDFNGDSVLDADDAIYLLYHTLFGDVLYPLNA